MRYIDTRRLSDRIPSEWETQASEALQAISNATPAERADAIDRNAGVWKALKSVLKELSHGKCWYCESRELRSTNAVDHFRPKSAIYEDKTHDGYWWLAVEPTNLRFSCEFCNSYGSARTRSLAGGKRTHFPLLDDSARVRDPDGRIQDEYPLLLDPVVSTDPALLWFDPDGMAVPDPELAADGVPYVRVERSTDIYNLNEAALTDARLVLSTLVSDLVDEADGYWRRVEGGDPTAKTAFDNAVRRLYELAQPAAEFSAAARSALMRLRASSGVPNKVLKVI